VPTLEQELWSALEERLGRPVSEPERRFLWMTGLVKGWQQEADRWRLVETKAFNTMAATLSALERSGLVPRQEVLPLSDDDDPPAPAGRRDGRWALWRDLRRRSGAPNDDWHPLRVALVVDNTNPVLQSTRVELSFDSRLSQGALIGEIRRLWPRLRAAHWVKAARVLGARAEALLRFVCLEGQPDTPWEKMIEGWNAKYPEWQHGGPQARWAFSKEVRRHEEQLTGRKYGLEWFYNTDARVSGEALREALGDLTVDNLQEAEEASKMTPAMRAWVREISPAVAEFGHGLVQKHKPELKIGPVRSEHADKQEGAE